MANNKVFETVKVDKPNKNVFDLSFETKMTGNMGELLPFMLQEVIPGDTFHVNSEILVRLMPMVSPVMHRVDVFSHFFFVPNRIIWEDWEEFITGGEDGLSAPTVPTLDLDTTTKNYFIGGKLPDYLGIPVYDGSTVWAQDYTISALPLRAYLQIYNDYYRDQNLKAEVDVHTSGWSQLNAVRLRAWEKDYFTSALPWTQRGADITLPLGTTADIDYDPSLGGSLLKKGATGATVNNYNANILTNATGHLIDGVPDILNWDISAHHEVDLSSANSADINEFRRAIKLQEWLEKMARGGSRYKEQLLHMFGVDFPDYTAQRAVYLGGGKQPVVITEVTQTAETRQWNSDIIIEPAGTMHGHGISVGKTNNFSYNFKEHGYVIGIVSVLPRTGYYQGINKTFLRTDKLDYYWSQFAQLGEQAIEMQELYVDYYNVNDIDETFGYSSRYAEYRYNQDRLAGEFRDSLSYWGLQRDFVTRPALNQTFYECDASHRVFANTVATDHKLVFQIWNNVKAIRPIPYYNVPTL